MLSRKFTDRERVLILILAVLLAGGLYFLAVWTPTSNSIALARSTAVELESLLIVERTKATLLQDMREKLEEIGHGEQALAITPDYDNVSNVVPLLNRALEKAGEYDLRFSPVAFEDSFALREIQMTFSTDSYDTAKDIVDELASGPYSCDIGTLRIDPQEADTIAEGGVRVTLAIVYYEAYSSPPAGE